MKGTKERIYILNMGKQCGLVFYHEKLSRYQGKANYIYIASFCVRVKERERESV